MDWNKIRKEARRLFNKRLPNHYGHLSFLCSEVLEEISNKYNIGFGVEGFCWSTNEGISYINTGDTYATTLIYDDSINRFCISTYGDYVELLDRRK